MGDCKEERESDHDTPEIDEFQGEKVYEEGDALNSFENLNKKRVKLEEIENNSIISNMAVDTGKVSTGEVASTMQLKSIIKSIDKNSVVLLSSSSNIESICAMSIFTQILKKETLKFEVKFIKPNGVTNSTGTNNTAENNSIVRTDTKPVSNQLTESETPTPLFKEYVSLIFETVKNGSTVSYFISNKPGCGCATNKLSGILILLSLAVEYDLVEQSVLWPCAVAFEYYSEVGIARGQDVDSRCKKCRDISKEIEFRFCLAECGAKLEERTSLLFTHTTVLFDTIKYGLRTVFSERLFSNRFCRCDRKIHEILAIAGISISHAAEKYATISQHMKKMVNDRFGLSKCYVLRSGHDLEIRAVEHAFIIGHYLSAGRENDAFLSLSRRELMDLEAGWKYHRAIVESFRELSSHVQRLAVQPRDALIFRLQNRGQRPEGWWNKSVLWILWQLCAGYMDLKGLTSNPAILIVEDGVYLYVYSESINLLRVTRQKKGEVTGALHSISRNFIIADSSIHHHLIRKIFSKTQ